MSSQLSINIEVLYLQVEVAGDWANAKPLLGLVAQQAYNKLAPGKIIELNLSKGLFVVSNLSIDSFTRQYTDLLCIHEDRNENL